MAQIVYRNLPDPYEFKEIFSELSIELTVQIYVEYVRQHVEIVNYIGNQVAKNHVITFEPDGVVKWQDVNDHLRYQFRQSAK